MTMKFTAEAFQRYQWLSRGACAAALGLALSGFTLAQQEPPTQEPPIQSQDQIPQADQQQAQPPAQQQAPAAQQSDRPTQSSQGQPPSEQAPPPPQQKSDRPPITSVDRMPQGPQDGGQQAAPQYRQENGQGYGQQNRGQYDQQNPSKFVPPPALLTIPAGTVVIMRLNNFLSSDRNQIGDQFTGVLEQPIVVNGWVVARRGQTVVGQVKSVKKAGRVKGTSQLGVELTDISLVNGQQAPILTELWKGSAGTSHGADAATIGGGTLLGAIIGSAADWGTGAAIGAGAGAAAGIGAVLLTRGRPTVLEPESQLTFRLVDPVKVDTTNGQQAFLPVSQRDFGNERGARPSLRSRGGYYGPYGPYYAPCGLYYPCYYGPGYAGIYTGIGWWGPGFYGGRWYGRRGYGRR
jgi:hypothetical protein